MECISPGRIVVAPESGWPDDSSFVVLLREELGRDIEFDFGIRDIIHQNRLELPSILKGTSLPFVGRVAEGEETHIASRLTRLSKVRAAIPDYLIRPSGPLPPITFNEAALDAVITEIGANPPDKQCGQGSTIGILDTGIDSSLIPAANIRPVQYNAAKPEIPGAPSDAIGHGSLVARIISKIAPAAHLVSVKTFEDTGTISGAIAALYLAQAAGPCDVLNLSFSLNCDPMPCDVCQAPAPAATNINQLSYLFSSYMLPLPNTVLVSAAGNNTNHLQIPAAFSRIVAVGSFDYFNLSPISIYKQVPKDRFVFAPGGKGDSKTAYGERPGFAGPAYLYGTSFATAFISAFAARTVCSRKGACKALGVNNLNHPSLLDAVLSKLKSQSNTSWYGFDPNIHGIGAVRF